MRDPMLAPIYGGFPKLGHLFGGSLNKDYRILWSNLGVYILENYHIPMGRPGGGLQPWIIHRAP